MIDASITFLSFLWSYGVSFVAVVADLFAAFPIVENKPSLIIEGDYSGSEELLLSFSLFLLSFPLLITLSIFLLPRKMIFFHLIIIIVLFACSRIQFYQMVVDVTTSYIILPSFLFLIFLVYPPYFLLLCVSSCWFFCHFYHLFWRCSSRCLLLILLLSF